MTPTHEQLAFFALDLMELKVRTEIITAKIASQGLHLTRYVPL
jgi:hypothetical protein